MILITYLPFYRIHELLLYFLLNMDLLKVERGIAYIDNVFHPMQHRILSQLLAETGIEIRAGNWRDRNSTFLQIIRDAKSEDLDALVIDSDNMIDKELMKIDAELVHKYMFYTVLDRETWDRKNDRQRFLSRSVKLQDNPEVFGYRVMGKWRGVFFLGPKQGVRLSRALLESINYGVLNKLSDALNNIDAGIRRFISDETTLGMLYYYSGFRITPFIVASSHKHHGSDPSYHPLLVATAHAELGSRLLDMGWRMKWYYARYKLSRTIHALT